MYRWQHLCVVLCTSGCARDPILDRADELASRTTQRGDVHAEGGGAKTGQPQGDGSVTPLEGGDGPQPGAELTPGVAEEPTAGNPLVPPPGGGAGPLTPGVAEEPTPGNPLEPPPGGGAGPLTAGVPEEPTPGVPDDPSPGAGGKKGEGSQGPTGRVAGTISAPRKVSGAVRVDVFDGDQRNLGGSRPAVVAMVEIDRVGDFIVDVPMAARRVWVGAYADTNGDGRPSVGEPSGWYDDNPVVLGGSIKGIDIMLVIEGSGMGDGLGPDFGG